MTRCLAHVKRQTAEVSCNAAVDFAGSTLLRHSRCCAIVSERLPEVAVASWLGQPQCRVYPMSTATQRPSLNVSISHVQGVAPHGQWCLNNFFAFAADGRRLSTSADDLYHDWQPKGHTHNIDVPADTVKVAFSVQDATLVRVGCSSRLVPPQRAVRTVLWSSLPKVKWTAASNNKPEHWHYNVVAFGAQEAAVSTSSLAKLLPKAPPKPDSPPPPTTTATATPPGAPAHDKRMDAVPYGPPPDATPSPSTGDAPAEKGTLYYV